MRLLPLKIVVFSATVAVIVTGCDQGDLIAPTSPPREVNLPDFQSSVDQIEIISEYLKRLRTVSSEQGFSFAATDIAGERYSFDQTVEQLERELAGLKQRINRKIPPHALLFSNRLRSNTFRSGLSSSGMQPRGDGRANVMMGPSDSWWGEWGDGSLTVSRSLYSGSGVATTTADEEAPVYYVTTGLDLEVRGADPYDPRCVGTFRDMKTGYPTARVPSPNIPPGSCDTTREVEGWGYHAINPVYGEPVTGNTNAEA